MADTNTNTKAVAPAAASPAKKPSRPPKPAAQAKPDSAPDRLQAPTPNPNREQIWKFTLVALIVGLGILLFRYVWPFIGGVLTAFTLYVLLRKMTFRLAEKWKRPTLAATVIVLGVVFFIIIPISLVVWMIVSKLNLSNLNVNDLISPAKQMFAVLNERFGVNLLSQEALAFVGSKATGLAQSLLSGVGSFLVNLAVAILLLFFLLNGGRRVEEYLSSVIPMKKVNKQETIDKITTMVRANAIGIPLVATLQGVIAVIGYSIFGVPNAGLAAVATGFCSVVPIVGTMTVWVPLCIYFAVMGQWYPAIGLLIYCAIFVSQSDNLLRFILQKKIANTHPLITIFGVIVGLSLFGFIGIIFGPLLVSLFLLFVNMFRKEYLSGEE